MKQEKYIKGSTLDNFLGSEGALCEAELIALKRVIAWEVNEAMKKQNISKTEMANKMSTSRAVVNRLLDPENTSLTLKNLEKAAHILNKKVQIELVDYA